jgi:hypothetical protein
MRISRFTMAAKLEPAVRWHFQGPTAGAAGKSESLKIAMV